MSAYWHLASPSVLPVHVSSWHTVCVPSVAATTAELEGTTDQD